ncbi:Rpr2-domain-containing protein [Xylona heveae TC161]|uniref:Rpr2-domain-containing protein n=1 Tax=Xylona heveae (strain CBS 132557 / TC161) TaxID=1328760 RepID=A0A165FEB5_XYLHT|nr:Rpr2-domain-containing protein [Xylona heveae TC161]KZF20882.1 Rpr2-domain-containing protein [Xylona heveae TC161]
MAKGTANSAAQNAQNVPNKHLHQRISFLYQAAAYIASQPYHKPSTTVTETPRQSNSHNISTADSDTMQIDTSGLEKSTSKQEQDGSHKISDENPSGASTSSLYCSHHSRRLISQLRGVSLKSQIRLSPELKRSICRRCDTLLIPGSTSTTRLENHSRGGKKPWADLLVVECKACGSVKRFPVGAQKQKRRSERQDKQDLHAAPDQDTNPPAATS